MGSPTSSLQIRLDIGGVKFTTTASTLARRNANSVLAAVANDCLQKSQTPGYECETVVFDRDGTHFKHILIWLRDGVVTRGLKTSVYLEILREAEYYTLPGLRKSVKRILGTYDDKVPEDVKSAAQTPDLRRLDVIRFTHCGLKLRGVNLSGLDLSNLDLSGGEFQYARLYNTNFENCDLRDANLEYCDAGGANFRNANLRFCNCTGAKMVGAVLDGADMFLAKFYSARLKNASLRKTIAVRAEFNDANLSRSNLSGAYMSGACLKNANLTDANLSDVEFSFSKHWKAGRADFQYATLTGANFHHAKLEAYFLRNARDYENTINLDESIRNKLEPRLPWMLGRNWFKVPASK